MVFKVLAGTFVTSATTFESASVVTVAVPIEPSRTATAMAMTTAAEPAHGVHRGSAPRRLFFSSRRRPLDLRELGAARRCAFERVLFVTDRW